MDNIVKSITTVFLIMLFMFLGLSIMTASLDAKNADTFCQNAAEEISQSDFSEPVIDSLINKAKNLNESGDGPGYELTVQRQSTHNDGRYDAAKVTLKYTYRIAFIGLFKEHSVTSWAR